MIGAVLGGAAEGAGRGLGAFSNALMQTLGSQQHRQQVRRAEEARNEQTAYNRHRDAVSDRQHAEAMELQQKYNRHRDAVSDRQHAEAMELQQKTNEARIASEDRHFAQTLRDQGYDFEYNPEGVAPPEGSIGITRNPNQRFRVGAYNPENDASVRRARATAAARSPSPSAPTFRYSVPGSGASGEFPMTEAGMESARGFGEMAAGLPGNREAPEVDPERLTLLINRVTSRAYGADGRIDPFKLNEVMDDLRSRAGVTQAELEALEARFPTEF